MNKTLNQQYEDACSEVNRILGERDELITAVTTAKNNLQRNLDSFDSALRKRNELHAMLSVIPSTPSKSEQEQLMEDRREVFKAFRQIKGNWIAPQGLSIITGIDSDVVSAILLRASKLDAVPVEHNGKRGRASMYRWVGK